MTALEGLLSLLPPTIKIKTYIDYDGFVKQDDRELIYYLCIEKLNREDYINSLGFRGKGKEFYEIDCDENGDLWRATYNNYGWEGIEYQLPQREPNSKVLKTINELRDIDDKFLSLNPLSPGAIGKTLEETLKTLYNWLKEENYVI